VGLIRLLISIGHLYLSGVLLGVDLRIDAKKASCVYRDWTKHSKFASHIKLNNSILGGDLYDGLLRRRIFTLTVEKIFIQAPNIKKKMAMVSNWNC
jgi:hypothetical protein